MNQLNQLIELTRSDLKRDDRQRIMSLITMDAHARDIVLMLIREGVTDKVSWEFVTTSFFLWELDCSIAVKTTTIMTVSSMQEDRATVIKASPCCTRVTHSLYCSLDASRRPTVRAALCVRSCSQRLVLTFSLSEFDA